MVISYQVLNCETSGTGVRLPFPTSTSLETHLDGVLGQQPVAGWQSRSPLAFSGPRRQELSMSIKLGKELRSQENPPKKQPK